jgi:hypothetical protein
MRAVGVDGATGGLIVEDAAAPGGERELLVGEVSHVRLGGTATESRAATDSAAATEAGAAVDDGVTN